MIVGGLSKLMAGIVKKTLTAEEATTLMMLILGGLGLLYSQDYTVGAKAHAESQAQIAELQLRSNIVPNAIESGDTTQLRQVPMTPAAVPPPPLPPGPPVAIQLPKP